MDKAKALSLRTAQPTPTHGPSAKLICLAVLDGCLGLSADEQRRILTFLVAAEIPALRRETTAVLLLANTIYEARDTGANVSHALSRDVQ